VDLKKQQKTASWLVATVLMPLLSACATTTPIPQGTLVLAEVSHMLTREEIRENRLGLSTKISNFDSRFKDWGYTDAQLEG
jgi:hypothetical protein